MLSYYWRTDVSVNVILIIELQKGQLILPQPHCNVESLGALQILTVRSGVMISLEAQSVFIAWWPDRMISLLAPSERWMSYRYENTSCNKRLELIIMPLSMQNCMTWSSYLYVPYTRLMMVISACFVARMFLRNQKDRCYHIVGLVWSCALQCESVLKTMCLWKTYMLIWILLIWVILYRFLSLIG